MCQGFSYNVVRITDPRMWNALAYRVVSRLPIAHSAGVGLIFALPFAKPMPTVKIAAETGFRTLSIDMMFRLIGLLQVPLPERKPRLEKDVAYVLVRWALPDAEENAVWMMVERRKLRPPMKFARVLSEANMAKLSREGVVGAMC